MEQTVPPTPPAASWTPDPGQAGPGRPDHPPVLADNDAYHALEKVGGLIHTGPTGTNVNDVAVVLLKADN